MKTEDNRIVVLIDMDCFYVQVEERENPQNKGKPACVVQYKNWKGGGIIAVNYEARAQGISRQMRGDEAREKCADCLLYRVPEQRGKADLTKYRDAGKEVIDVLCSFGVCIERASIDEAYLDVTSVVNDMMNKSTDNCVTSNMLPNTHIVGLQTTAEDGKGVCEWLTTLSEGEHNEKNWKLTHAAVLCERMRAAVFEKTGFRCSAGISSNKMLAKLACGINKPNKQTILPPESVEEFFKTFPLKKVRHLGGKLGLILREELNCTTMGDIVNLSESVLQQRFDTKTSAWLYWYARGVDHEAVSSRRLPKSIGCNKNFSGIAALDTREKIHHWLEELCAEVSERLEKDRATNQRCAKLLTLTVRLDGDTRPYSFTRSIPLTPTYDHKVMAKACLAVMVKENTCKKPDTWDPVVTCIGVSASKFDEAVENNSKIDRFFSIGTSKNKSGLSTAEKGQISLTSAEKNGGDFAAATHLNDTAEEKPHFFPADESSQEETETPVREMEKEFCPPSCFPSELSVDPPKKLGFFASKGARKTPETNETPIVEVECDTSDTPDDSQQEEADQEINPLIKELFPDLNEIELDTVKLLPLELQREIFKIIELKKGKTKDEIRQKTFECCVCHNLILEEEKELHNDYHLALELQKQTEPRASLSSGAPSNNTNNKKADKRPLQKQNGKSTATKRSRTIESFFKSS